MRESDASFCRRTLWFVGVVCWVWGASAALAADGDGGSASSKDDGGALKERGDHVDMSAEGLEAWIPEGWVRAGDGSNQTLLKLRAAGRDRIRMEVRVQRDLDGTDLEQFFSSFHSTLLSRGFRRAERRDRVTRGGKTGVESVYEVRAGERPYRLVIWQISRGQTAWLVTGFFPEARLSEYREEFDAFVSALNVDEGAGREADGSQADDSEPGSGVDGRESSDDT